MLAVQYKFRKITTTVVITITKRSGPLTYEGLSFHIRRYQDHIFSYAFLFISSITPQYDNSSL